MWPARLNHSCSQQREGVHISTYCSTSTACAGLNCYCLLRWASDLQEAAVTFARKFPFFLQDTSPDSIFILWCEIYSPPTKKQHGLPSALHTTDTCLFSYTQGSEQHPLRTTSFSCFLLPEEPPRAKGLTLTSFHE